MVLYLVSIDWVERLLHQSFRAGVEHATRVNPADGPIVTQIQNRVSELVSGSPWVRYGGVRVNATVLGADGQTPLYVGGGKVLPPPPERSLDGVMREWMELLPAISDVYVSVPHGSALSAGIFVGYGAILVQSLVFYTRRMARQAQAHLAAAVAARDSSADRARAIEEELAKVRDRLREVEPAERAQAAEIDALEQERVELHAKLRELAEREGQLRASASRAGELEDERQALEELLEEALQDVSNKDAEIAALQDRLQERGQARRPRRARGARARPSGSPSASARSTATSRSTNARSPTSSRSATSRRSCAPKRCSSASTTTPTPPRSAARWAGSRPISRSSSSASRARAASTTCAASAAAIACWRSAARRRRSRISSI